MDKFSNLVGRSYHLFDYIGAPDAERVVIIMASGGETAEATVRYLMAKTKRSGLFVSGFTVHSQWNISSRPCRKRLNLLP